MPMNKDFKRLVRARMQKTGEAYTTARTNLLRKPAPGSVAAVSRAATRPEPAASATITAPPKPTYAALAGLSDAAVKRATGCTWEKWVWALDQAGADSWSHRAIADYVHTTYKVPDWWTQTVTVGYERIKGLREIGQRRGGGYEATKSKTIAAPASAVYRAFADGRVRRKWLPGVAVTVRKGTPGKSVRMTWNDGTSVEVWLTPKGPAKTVVQVQHRRLTDRDDAERRRRYWTERLMALPALVENA